MSDVQLGFLVDGAQSRDAIHVAVVPMIASEMLRPGQRVGAMGNLAGPSSHVLGIVDPYLTDVVPKGATFWMCLLPNIVTGMRHEWQHPAFDSQPGSRVTDDKAAAEAWLRDQCESLGCTFEDLVSDRSDLVCGEYILNDMNEAARDHWYEIQYQFWVQRKIYTGKDVAEKDRGGFTCSC